MKPALKRGDFFCTRNPAYLGKAIIAVETVQDKDGKARYGHSGIITDETGTTLEALWTFRGNHLDAYKDKEMLIGRWSGMTDEAFWKGMDAIKNDINDKYPWYRLILILFGLGKIKTGHEGVCSEELCKFLIGAGNQDIGEWCGQTPADVENMIKKWKGFDVIFEGEWT